MKSLSLILPLTILGSFSGISPTDTPASLRAAQTSFDCSLFRLAGTVPQKPADTAGLGAVLKKMDSVSANFRTTQAEFQWDTYEKVIDEVDDVETGTIYYRRNSKELEMMAEVKKAGTSLSALKPEPKYVLVSNGKVRMYQPKVDQITEFDLGKNRSEFESYLVLGFGGSGQDLQKAFDVTYVGPETIDGVATAKLELVPKSEKVRGTYSKIFLWIDLDRGISVQQQLFQPQGDYRLAKYSDLQVNGKKIPDEVFKLKTTSKTQTVSPKG
jgi:outer membrane lipoprotein-sorting protein